MCRACFGLFQISNLRWPTAVTEKLMRIAGSPELGGTRGAQHEDVPEQSHGVQEPSHGVPGGAVVTGSVSQPRDMLEDFIFNFNLRIVQFN